MLLQNEGSIMFVIKMIVDQPELSIEVSEVAVKWIMHNTLSWSHFVLLARHNCHDNITLSHILLPLTQKYLSQEHGVTTDRTEYRSSNTEDREPRKL